jgi:hypothetical protein
MNDSDEIQWTAQQRLPTTSRHSTEQFKSIKNSDGETVELGSCVLIRCVHVRAPVCYLAALSLSLCPSLPTPIPHSRLPFMTRAATGGSRHHSGKDSETGKTGMPYIVRALPLSLSYPTPALKPCAVEAAAHSPGGAQEQRRALSAAMHAHGRGREL